MNGMKRDFLGTGWSFPPRLNPRGEITTVSDVEDVEEAILIILQTRVGERMMRPEFGSRLNDLVFMPCDAATAGLANAYVFEALVRWEPRIVLVEVRAAPDPASDVRLLINIKYRIATENSERNLVYPFYVIPGEH